MTKYIAAFIVTFFSLCVAAHAAPPKGHGARLPAPQGVTVYQGRCPDAPSRKVEGCAYISTNVIYVRRLNDRRTLWHEYGHVWQARHPQWDSILQDALDNNWLQFFSRTEEFAELYASCALDWKWTPRVACMRILNED